MNVFFPPSSLQMLGKEDNDNFRLASANARASWALWIGGNPCGETFVANVEYETALSYIRANWESLILATGLSSSCEVEELLLSLFAWYILDPTKFSYWYDNLYLDDLVIPTGDKMSAVSEVLPLFALFCRWTPKEQ